MKKHITPYLNRAKTNNDITQDCTDFECCHEELVFAMKDNYHEFSMGLTTLLACLAIAEKEGAVPKLPSEWWCMIRRY